jgi:hypothetical protein
MDQIIVLGSRLMHDGAESLEQGLIRKGATEIPWEGYS